MRASIFFLFPLCLLANPAGEKVVCGQVAIERPSSHSLQVTQLSPQAIVEWNDFSVGTNESTTFIQPSSSAAILNRVVGGNLSEIYGQMQGNGKVFLINPNGILVGPSGIIDCAGFLGAALDIENQAFLAGRDFVFTGNPEATLVNQGTIQTGDGYLFLVGPNVTNEGQLLTRKNNAHLVEGEVVTISSLEDPKVTLRPAPSAFKSTKAGAETFAVNRGGQRDATVVRKVGARIFLEFEEDSSLTLNSSSIWDNPSGTNAIVTQKSLDAQQELRTIIPERLWDQEFAWLIDGPAFEKATAIRQTHRRRDRSIPSLTAIGTSEFYILRSTTSGEAIRLPDRTMEFLDSPYWKTPEAEYSLPYQRYAP